MPGKRLWMTIGLPRSGKSTFSRLTGFPIVNPDAIRLGLCGQRFYAPAEPMVWASAKLMAYALFAAGHMNVILDATNVTRKRRDDWKSTIWTRCFIVIPTPAATCIQRALAEHDDAILQVIDRMDKEWEVLAEEEFDAGCVVQRIDGTEPVDINAFKETIS